MSDLSPLENELADQLRSRAADAKPPADAWERFDEARALRGSCPSYGLFDGDASAVVPIQIESDTGSHDMNGSIVQRLGTSRVGLGAIAAAIVAVAALGIGVLISGDGEDGTTADVVEQIALTSPTDVMNQYFQALALEDFDGAMGLFSDEATFASAGAGSQTAKEFKVFAIWEAAQQMERLEVECALSQTDPERVNCTHRDHAYLSSVVGGPAVPNSTSAQIIDGQIASIRITFGQPDYNTVNVPFNAWISENYPEVADRTGCCFDDEAEEAQANGELRVEYADLWAADLKANLCTYNVPCESNPMSDYFAAFEAGDVDAVMALFSEGATFDVTGAGVDTADEFEAFMTWDVAQKGIWLDPQCSAGDQTRQVVCTYDDHQYLSRIVGARAVPNTATAIIVGGEIAAIETVSGGPNYLFVTIPFDEWIRKNHPDLLGQIGCCSFTTNEAARLNGELTVEYADLWVAYLEANNCQYNDNGC